MQPVVRTQSWIGGWIIGGPCTVFHHKLHECYASKCTDLSLLKDWFSSVAVLNTENAIKIIIPRNN